MNTIGINALIIKNNYLRIHIFGGKCLVFAEKKAPGNRKYDVIGHFKTFIIFIFSSTFANKATL